MACEYDNFNIVNIEWSVFRRSRSSLLTKVMIGSRQTSKSVRVCSSMPFAASETIAALSTAVRVRVGVLVQIPVARRL